MKQKARFFLVNIYRFGFLALRIAGWYNNLPGCGRLAAVG